MSGGGAGREIRKLREKKPVIASMSDVAASGALLPCLILFFL
jgi:ClpP class serine protease